MGRAPRRVIAESGSTESRASARAARRRAALEEEVAISVLFLIGLSQRAPGASYGAAGLPKIGTSARSNRLAPQTGRLRASARMQAEIR
ncbi:hypothetical protein AB870_12545 [Pandoraea faecigallinarum]|uniref:Uncharacterized protein n=1 Tax=Pandoraea faecigallinarum TaxID=656179 RepID=A0A0H3WW59_9BURK|nr:hypothetical protein AB870_12545 [Pandoraea faecigallinarum]